MPCCSRSLWSNDLVGEHHSETHSGVWDIDRGLDFLLRSTRPTKLCMKVVPRADGLSRLYRGLTIEDSIFWSGFYSVAVKALSGHSLSSLRSSINYNKRLHRLFTLATLLIVGKLVAVGKFGEKAVTGSAGLRPVSGLSLTSIFSNTSKYTTNTSKLRIVASRLVALLNFASVLLHCLLPRILSKSS